MLPSNPVSVTTCHHCNIITPIPTTSYHHFNINAMSSANRVQPNKITAFAIPSMSCQLQKPTRPCKNTAFTTLSMSYHLQRNKTLYKHNFHNPVNVISSPKTLQSHNFHNPINVISSAKREKAYKITTFTTLTPHDYSLSINMYVYIYIIFRNPAQST